MDLQRSKRSLEIWDVGLEFVKCSRNIGLELGRMSSRRAVECNLVECLRHIGDESRVVRRASCNVLVDEFKVSEICVAATAILAIITPGSFRNQDLLSLIQAGLAEGAQYVDPIGRCSTTSTEVRPSSRRCLNVMHYCDGQLTTSRNRLSMRYAPHHISIDK